MVGDESKGLGEELEVRLVVGAVPEPPTSQ
jgi:hypothetical protein